LAERDAERDGHQRQPGKLPGTTTEADRCGSHRGEQHEVTDQIAPTGRRHTERQQQEGHHAEPGDAPESRADQARFAIEQQA
jgi:hypothetical protein